MFQSFAYILSLQNPIQVSVLSQDYCKRCSIYCLSTVNLSRHNYFLANKNLLFYWCLFVYIIKRTVHSGLKIWILLSRTAKTMFYSLAVLVRKILFCHSKIKFISSRHHVISFILSIYFAPFTCIILFSAIAWSWKRSS